MNKFYFILTLSLMLFSGILYSQSIDSLKIFICEKKNDSLRNEYIRKELIKEYFKNDFLKNVNEFLKASTLCDVQIDGKIYYWIANQLQYKQHYKESIEFHHLAQELFRKTDNKEYVALSVSSEGYLMYVIGNYDEAADILVKNEKYCIENKLKSPLDKTYMGLGFIYRDLQAYGKALEFFEKSLKVAEENQNKQYIYTAYNEMGNVYLMSENYEKAISYHMKSIAIKEELKDSISLAYSYNDISLDYSALGDYKKALEYLNKSVEICKKKNMTYILIANYLNIADIYLKMGKTGEAENLLNQAMEYANSLHVKSEQATVYSKLSDIKAFKKDFEKAYDYHVLYKIYNDSVLNESVVNKLNDIAAQYEFEKNRKEIELLNKDKELKQAEIDQQLIYRNSLIIGVILLILLLAVFVNRFLLKKRANIQLSLKNEEIVQQKEEIQSQRDEIEAQRDKLVLLNEEVISQRDFVVAQRDEISQKNKEINDSINYAKQIQTAMLSFEDSVLDFGLEHFIIFKPKDVVSGDFYWFNKKQNKLIAIAADCTGHGVPGAFMSILGISALNEIINNFDLDVSIILNELRNKVIKSLHQSNINKEMHLRDGMDISICIVDNENKELQYAGANNPVYIVRQNDSLALESQNNITEGQIKEHDFQNCKFYELKPDKFPIGVYGEQLKPFNKIVISYDEGDRIYLFSDGYFDQFGGDSNKKLKADKLRQFISLSCTYDMNAQKEFLETKFNEWKGNDEQVDDVLIVGLKL